MVFIKVDWLEIEWFVIFNCNNFDSIVLSAFQLVEVGPTFDYVGPFLTVDAGHLSIEFSTMEHSNSQPTIAGQETDG